jgi:hypothetical protein
MTSVILKNLQKELTLFLVSIAIATLIIVISQSWWQSARNDRDMAANDLLEAKQRYYTALDQKKLLEEFENKFLQLEELGVIGNEQRLSWVDAIETITADNKIPYIKYKIDKRQPANSQTLTENYPGIDLFKSKMILDMQLLHEGDLYTIINALNARAKGLFDVNSCTIIRNPAQVTSLIQSTTDKNFSVVCELNWYTMQKKTLSLSRGDNI